jgi:hypothetical protein
MKLAQLRKIGTLQAHHWKAAVWFAELPISCDLRTMVRVDFDLIARQNRSVSIHPYDLLRKACVEDRPISGGPDVVGILREALNAAHRIMNLKGGNTA